eukprot:TRINITY_DN9372_c0_g1_i1.p1 TRINITY_DN9372_c0_g1~~TRINITY_DN9372_c0_g1_i1.p1  ORF type:complete len:188 (+),score=19.30 TRINITY_DN9372_c0_g1_i1:42-605(+)
MYSISVRRVCSLYLCIFFFLSNAKADVRDDERLILQELYNATMRVVPSIIVSNSKYNDWTSPTTDHCTWTGISCDGEGRVSRLIVKGGVMKGNLPYSLRGLTRIQHLDLSLNNLEGTLPDVLSTMTVLDYVDISSNLLLSGTIPPIPPSVITLHLFYTHISGSLPDYLFLNRDSDHDVSLQILETSN